MTPLSPSQSSPAVAPLPVLKPYFDDEAGRIERTKTLFNASASHYDWITSMMSFGSGRWYRRDALRRHGLAAGTRLLDVGAGTGVISLIAQDVVGSQGEVIAADPSEGMLAVARQSGVRQTVLAGAESLPFEADRFDLLSMGYALRHVSDLVLAFREYHRVLRPGGKVLLLEISRPAGKGLGYALLRFYMRKVIPAVTRIFRRSADAELLMRYYWDTIDQCVPPETIVAALGQAGFQNAQRHVVFGIFSEYSATK